MLVDGLYSSSVALRGYFDYTVWVDCPSEMRLMRGGRQDITEPVEKYVRTERPITHADLVLDGQGDGDMTFRIVRKLDKDRGLVR